MEPAELCRASVTDLARLIATKAVSSEEVTRAHLDRIQRLDPTLRSYITVCADDAIKTAKYFDSGLSAGVKFGPLHGVPIAFKDVFDTEGVRTTGGSKILADRVPKADATVVARLLSAGAVMLGKLNMHEFAYGPEGINEHYGNTLNPWGPAARRIPGGSSSGSGAAVAAGLAPAALGSDTAGSIRNPSSLCGITGLKPTFGRVSRAGVLPLSWSMDHVGPMARSAADCALLLREMAGRDPRDPTASTQPVPDYTEALTGDVKGLRVGRLTGSVFTERLAPELRTALDTAVKKLSEMGAVVDEVKVSFSELAAPGEFAIIAAEAFTYHAEWLRTRSSDYQQDVRDRLFIAAFVDSSRYVLAQRIRAMVRDGVNEALAKHDVLLAPATTVAAPQYGELQVLVDGNLVDIAVALLKCLWMFNFSGHPACSVPCGFSVDWLPLGMQVIGKAFDEATVLRVADAWQRVTDWHTRRLGPNGEEIR